VGTFGSNLYLPLENVVLPSYVTPIDYTTVTSVYLNVTRTLDQSTATWTAQALTNVTTSGLVAVYTFGVGDLTIACPYVLDPWAVIGSVAIPFTTAQLYVLGSFGP
jgi:hypothetical protein